MTRLFHIVRHHAVPDWLRLGWIARPILNGTHHGEYSAVVEWLCECRPVMPRDDPRETTAEAAAQ